MASFILPLPRHHTTPYLQTGLLFRSSPFCTSQRYTSPCFSLSNPNDGSSKQRQKDVQKAISKWIQVEQKLRKGEIDITTARRSFNVREMGLFQELGISVIESLNDIELKKRIRNVRISENIKQGIATGLVFVAAEISYYFAASAFTTFQGARFVTKILTTLLIFNGIALFIFFIGLMVLLLCRVFPPKFIRTSRMDIYRMLSWGLFAVIFFFLDILVFVIFPQVHKWDHNRVFNFLANFLARLKLDFSIPFTQLHIRLEFPVSWSNYLKIGSTVLSYALGKLHSQFLTNVVFKLYIIYSNIKLGKNQRILLFAVFLSIAFMATGNFLTILTMQFVWVLLPGILLWLLKGRF